MRVYVEPLRIGSGGYAWRRSDATGPWYMCCDDCRRLDHYDDEPTAVAASVSHNRVRHARG